MVQAYCSTLLLLPNKEGQGSSAVAKILQSPVPGTGSLVPRPSSLTYRTGGREEEKEEK